MSTGIPTPRERPHTWWAGPAGVKEVWQVAWPLILSMGSQTMMMFSDRMFLAWHSGVSLRAALPAGILSFTMLCGFLALTGYANTFVAQYHGAGDHRGCLRTTAQATWLAWMLSPLVLALLPVGRAVLRWSGHPADVLAEELDYFTILMWGNLPSLLGTAAASYFSGRGDTWTTFRANLAANLLNVALDYWLIFGGLGLPPMGIRGAAIATVISSCATPLILYTHLFRRGKEQGASMREVFWWNTPLFLRLVRFGLPSGIQLALDLTSFTFFVLLCGRFGEAAHAASNLALSINSLAFMPAIGLGIAAGIVVGQYQGRGDSGRAARAGWTALAMAVIYMGLVGLSYVIFPAEYVRLFTDRGGGTAAFADVFPIARVLLIMLAIWEVGDACDLVVSGALKGAGDTRFVMWYSLVLAWGFFVAGLAVIGRVFHGGLYPCWGWATLYIHVMAVGYLVRFWRGRWKNIDLLGRREIEPLPPPARPGEEGLVAG